MIETAAILAAGRGTRLGSLAEARPKGLLTLGDRPIVEESIEKLLAVGVTRIVIGTGFGSHHYEQLARRYPAVRCIRNPEFDVSGSMHTLYQLRDAIDGRFLLLESDLIYERVALEALLEADGNDLILASDFTGAGDEVYIEVDLSSNLVAMSKDRDALSRADAELVGISAISPTTLAAMCRYAETAFEHSLTLDYEDALVAVARERDIAVLRVDGLAWAEIDDASHLQRARELHPEIQRREARLGTP